MTGSAATWRCCCCRRPSSGPRGSRRSRSGQRRRPRCARNLPTSHSWPRSIGTSNGHCSSRASTTAKRFYDRLREPQVRPIRDHLAAGLDFQDKLARFLENHDEPRAAAPGGSDHYFFFARTALFLSGPVRGGAGARADASLPCSGRADEPGNRRLLCQAITGLKETSAVRGGAWVYKSNRESLGSATGPRTTLLPTPGLARRATVMSSSSITPATSGNAVCRCNSRSPAASRYVLPIPWGPRSMIATAASSWRAVSTSITAAGTSMCLSCRTKPRLFG